MNFAKAVAEYSAKPAKSTLDAVVGALLKEMTLKEKIKVLQGDAFCDAARGAIKYFKAYNAIPWHAGGIKRLGIPAVKFTDGPRGIVMGHATAFPVSMLRGATFDEDLEYRVGVAIAKEGVSFGANYFAGICINLLRNPKWGRAQETYGEDPCLLGKMGAALTRAVQDNGMIACPKHYAMNSIEDLRFDVNVKADERTLREVYLPHFKKCIDAGALSIMGAYNKVNDTHCCENKVLLTDILRGDWGFDGFTLSDFLWGVYDAERSLNAGMDIEMPLKMHYRKIGKYLKQGKLTEEVINKSAACVLGALIRIQPAFDKAYAECEKAGGKKSVVFSRENRALAREVAEKGIVLLKNEGKLLPIADKKAKIAVVGRYADVYNIGDHGSSMVKTPYVVSTYAGIKEVYPNSAVYNGLNIARALKVAKGADYVLVCVGSDHKDEGEFLLNIKSLKSKPLGVGGDRVSMKIRDDETALIKALAAAGHKVIVNIIGGSAYVVREWIDDVKAVFTSFYSGTEGGRAIADIVSGKVNPSGRLPFTMARKEEDYPPFKYIGERPYEIEYGYYHGYTLFDKKGVKPEFPFGFGLSYSEFEIKDFKAECGDGVVNVAVKVANNGDRDGDTVVQVYFGSEEKSEDRPVKLLKGFARVHVKAGAAADVTVSVPVDDLAFWNTATHSWKVDKSYKVYAGLDSADAASRFCEIDF